MSFRAPYFRRSILVAMLPVLLVAAGCGGGGTKLNGTWTNPEYIKQEGVDEVLVVAIAESDTGRRMWESTLVSELQREGINAYPSTKFHPSVEKLSESQANAMIEENGIEAVIVTRLLDVDREEVDVPASTTVSTYPGYGSPYYGSMYGYYSYGHSVTYSSGYSYETVTVVLETNLYDGSNKELIWSAQSSTIDPGSTQDVIQPTVGLIVNQLVAQRLLSRGK